MDVLCFGGEDWWYHNRAHIDIQLMRRFAKRGTALYINSIVMQKPSLGEGRVFFRRLLRKTKSVLTGLKKSDAGFWVYSPFVLPVHHITWATLMNEQLLKFQLWLIACKLRLHSPIVCVACPTACNIAVRSERSKLIYLRIDRFEDYPNVHVKMILQFDQMLKNHADLTVYVNRRMYEDEKKQCRKAIFLDHGVDFEMFSSAQYSRYIPSDIPSVPKPIAGYFGDLDDYKLDIGFLAKVIDRLPEISFVFIGKASPKFSELAGLENVWLLGQKPYEQIPHYGKCFDVVMLPWIQNRWTQAANPIKVKEYLALGKPFVSTPVFTQIQEYLDVAYVANTPEDFANCIIKALNEDSPERIAARRKKVQHDTWDIKAQIIFKELFGNNELV